VPLGRDIEREHLAVAAFSRCRYAATARTPEKLAAQPARAAEPDDNAAVVAAIVLVALVDGDEDDHAEPADLGAPAGLPPARVEMEEIGARQDAGIGVAPRLDVQPRDLRRVARPRPADPHRPAACFGRHPGIVTRSAAPSHAGCPRRAGGL
jgi:hypothetical protein